MLSVSSYSVVSPFMPAVFKLRDIDEVIIGLIFATFSVAVILLSPLMGSVI